MGTRRSSRLGLGQNSPGQTDGRFWDEFYPFLTSALLETAETASSTAQENILAALAHENVHFETSDDLTRFGRLIGSSLQTSSNIHLRMQAARTADQHAAQLFEAAGIDRPLLEAIVEGLLEGRRSLQTQRQELVTFDAQEGVLRSQIASTKDFSAFEALSVQRNHLLEQRNQLQEETEAREDLVYWSGQALLHMPLLDLVPRLLRMAAQPDHLLSSVSLETLHALVIEHILSEESSGFPFLQEVLAVVHHYVESPPKEPLKHMALNFQRTLSFAG